MAKKIWSSGEFFESHSPSAAVFPLYFGHKSWEGRIVLTLSTCSTTNSTDPVTWDQGKSPGCAWHLFSGGQAFLLAHFQGKSHIEKEKAESSDKMSVWSIAVFASQTRFKHNGLHSSSFLCCKSKQTSLQPWSVCWKKTPKTFYQSGKSHLFFPQTNGHVSPFPLCNNELIW